MPYEKNLCQYAKSFFGFNNRDGEITIVVPHVKQTRVLSLRCRNYPLFDYEISPDDAFSTFRILCLLTAIYGTRKRVSLVNDGGSLPQGDSICVGGPPTNGHIRALTQPGPLKFGHSNIHRSIQGSKGMYWIEFDGPSGTEGGRPMTRSLSIVQDYCLIAKNTTPKNHVRFVVGGLRAYGQRAAYEFLGDRDFYRKIKGLLPYPFFRVLVGVKVDGYHITDPWQIIEQHATTSEKEWKKYNNVLSIFLSHLHTDWTRKVKILKDRLRQEYFDVFSMEDIPAVGRWREAIRREIERRDVVVVCVSQSYARRKKTVVDEEISLALELNKLIVVVRLDDCPVHYPALEDREWSDLFGDWTKPMSAWTTDDWAREKNLRGLIRGLYKEQLEKKCT